MTLLTLDQRTQFDANACDPHGDHRPFAKFLNPPGPNEYR